MLLDNPTRIICIFLQISCLSSKPSKADTACLHEHNGKQLDNVELFEGNPRRKIELMPEDGRFVVPQIPRADWKNIPNYELLCSYAGTVSKLTVMIPKNIKVCRFSNYPKLHCN